MTKGLAGLAAALAAGLLLAASASSVETDRAGQIATLPPVGDHWVWVPDRVLAHSVLIDGDAGRVLATLSSPGLLTPKLPLFARSRGEFYSADVDYARGTRGARTDYVTIYDAETLGVAGEVVLPHPTSASNTSLHHATLLDGDRFLVVFSQFPETLATVVDLESREIVSAIPIAGCAGVYAVGPRRFATLCGDGTTLAVSLGPDGEAGGTARSPRFFDVVEDPVSMAGVRLDATWLFVSFAGQVHAVDFGGAEPAPQPPWSLVDDAEREAGWRPGGLQPHALHRDTKRLFVLMHEGSPGSHKDAGPEIWSFDVARRERLGRIEVPNLAVDFLGPMLGIEGFLRTLLGWVVPNPGAHALALTQDAEPLIFTRNAELGAMAVLDATTGEHLRSVAELGLAGPTLGVP